MTTRIVIGDDHPLVQAALRTALAAMLRDLDVLEFGTLDEVLAGVSVQPETIDLVLLDLDMPGSRGFAGLFLMLAQFPTVPVAIISAQQDIATVRKAIAYGASGFIPKSLDLPAMAQAILRILAGEIFAPADLPRAGPPDEDLDLGARLASLSAQQMRILAFIVEGKLNKQIADELAIAEQTVKVHVSTILRKLGAVSRTQAAVMAQRLLGAGRRPRQLGND